jgi:hypothetical protein
MGGGFGGMGGLPPDIAQMFGMGGMGRGMGGGSSAKYADRVEELDPFDDDDDDDDPLAELMRKQFAEARKTRRQHEAAHVQELQKELKRRQADLAAQRDAEAKRAEAAALDAMERLRAAMGRGQLEELRQVL